MQHSKDDRRRHEGLTQDDTWWPKALPEEEEDEACLTGRGSFGRLLQPPGSPLGSIGARFHIKADHLSGRPADCWACLGPFCLLQEAPLLSH